MKKLLVICGGQSSEHIISRMSCTSVLENIHKELYEITLVGIEKDGTWYKYIDTLEERKIGEKVNNKERIENVIEELKKLDILFPVLHGLYGEDGTIQGMFKLINKPFVGCGVLASSVGMDKVYTKIVFEKAGLKQARYEYIRKYKENYIYVDKKFNEEILQIDKVVEKIVNNLKFPMFIKPSNSGSSVGVNKAKNKEELKKYIEQAAEFHMQVYTELKECEEMDRVLFSLMVLNFVFVRNGIPCIHILYGDFEEYEQAKHEFLKLNKEAMLLFLLKVLKKNTYLSSSFYDSLTPLTRSMVIHKLNEHKEQIKNSYAVQSLWLYGSFAKGIERFDSDVDLLVRLSLDLTQDERKEKVKGLTEYLQAIFHRFVDIHEVYEYIPDEMIKEAIKLKKII